MIIPKIHFRQPVIGKGYVEISNTNIFVCELDLYDGQSVISNGVIVWGQNPAQNV